MKSLPRHRLIPFLALAFSACLLGPAREHSDDDDDETQVSDSSPAAAPSPTPNAASPTPEEEEIASPTPRVSPTPDPTPREPSPWSDLFALCDPQGDGTPEPSPPPAEDASPTPSDADPTPNADATPAPSPTPAEERVDDMEIVLDPYDAAPLSAVLKVRHPDLNPSTVEKMTVVIEGLDGPDSDLVGELDPQSDAFKANFDVSDLLEDDEIGVPVLGLYPGTENRVGFILEAEGGSYRGCARIETDAVSDFEGEIVSVDVLNPERMQPGMTYMDDRVYDHYGRYRWAGPKIHQILRNGNILSSISEFNWLGKAVKKRTLPAGYVFHHDAIELPNGNIVTCVDDNETTIESYLGNTVTSVEDAILELDAESSEVVNAWDLREFLDVTRGTVTQKEEDWLHMNTLWYDEYDDSLIISGRYQGIIKMSRGGLAGSTANDNKELKWILAPELDWGLAGPEGEGPFDPNDYLLTAVDSSGRPYESAVQCNLSAPPENGDPFYWPVGQHGLRITKRTENTIRIMTFSNQGSFIFDGVGTVNNGVSWSYQGDLSNDRANPPYSVAVEYEIDERAMTVRQVWSFGDYRNDLYGSYHSSVNYDPETGNRFFISNGADQQDLNNNPYNPNIIEIADDGEVVFHLQVTHTDHSAYRAGRIDLYHPGR